MTNTIKTEKKVTKKDRFNQLLAIEDVAMNSELVAFIEHELELLDKKASSKAKGKNEETEKLMEKLATDFEALEGKKVTVTEFITISPTCIENGFSSQKVAPVLKKMVAAGIIENTVEGKKSLYWKE